MTVGSISPPRYLDSGVSVEEFMEALPINEAIIDTRSYVIVGPPPSLSDCCYVEGTRKSYRKPFPTTQIRGY